MLQNGSGYFAWVVGDDNRAHRRALTLGEQTGQRYPVLDGIEANERVVVEGTQRVQDNAPVNIVN